MTENLLYNPYVHMSDKFTKRKSEKVFDTSQLFIEIYFGGHCTLISLNDINHINLIYILKDR